MTARTPATTLVRRLRRMSVAALATAGLALGGCSSTGPSSDGGGADGGEELRPLTVLSYLPLESYSFTPEMYAYAGGYFEDNGLDVTLQSVQGSAPAVQAIIGGAADITRVSSVDIMPGLEDGQPVDVVGVATRGLTLRLVSSEENPIETPEDLEGATIGLGSIGGTSERQLNFSLDNAGVPRDSVERQAVPVTAATFELVRQGQLDGYVVSLDTSIAIANQNDDAVVSEAGLNDSLDAQVWIVNEAELDDPEQAELIQPFLTAIRQAMQAVVDDADEDYANVIQTLRDSGEFTFAALDDDAIGSEAIATLIEDEWYDDERELELLEIDADDWSAIYDQYADGGLVDGDADPTEWLNDEYLPAE